MNDKTDVRQRAREDVIKEAYEIWCLPRMWNHEPDHPADAFSAGYRAALSSTAGVEAELPYRGEMTNGECADKLQSYLDAAKEHDPAQWPRAINPCIQRAIYCLRNPPFQRFIAESEMAQPRGHNGRGGDHECADPQPFAGAAVRELPEKWRAWRHAPEHPVEECLQDERAAEIFDRCADELEAALRSQTESGGRIVGSTTIDGVHVIVASPFSDMLDSQFLVRYDDYLSTLRSQPVSQRVPEGSTREEIADLRDRLVSAGISEFLSGDTNHAEDRRFIHSAVTEAWQLCDELLAAAPHTGPTSDDMEFFALPPDLHPNTANLVARFATALAAKLAAAEKKYGYSDGWAGPNWMDECRQKLNEHVAKGDPRDVAAYCAFLWHHGEGTAPSPVAALENEHLNALRHMRDRITKRAVYAKSANDSTNEAIFTRDALALHSALEHLESCASLPQGDSDEY
jgi:hypothetical protein